ncbi:unnamed protein product [Rotaria sp. Silwood1]|nr:unnamed protein product [Rotaria sp. Silwood1]CAF3610593.1 unnamed protein product [Rotaria sp. Silwood1]CAF4743703.1 unnamed protein product [Rotaria sp. Silwood1]CAF4774136.1 unnamed protein product [Rotaria sp. Silwood1]
MTTNSNNINPEDLREQGNQAFKQGKYQDAIDQYTEALNLLINLSLSERIKTELTKCYSNRSQCYINLNQYEDAIEDATRALEYTPADQKSLYRRSTAFEHLGKLHEAISDAQRLISISSKGSEQTNILLRKLRESAQSKHTQQTQLTSQIQQMFEIMNIKSNQETALNNLLVISREDAGAEGILTYDCDLRQIKEFIQTNERIIVLGFIRVLASIVRNSYQRAETIYNKLGLQLFARCLAMNDTEIPASTAILVHNMIMSICDLENRRKIQKPINVPFNFDQSVIEFINNIFRLLNELIDDKTCSAIGRDCCLDLVAKFVDRANGCNWISKFIVSGVPKVLRVAATVPNLPDNDKKSYSITEQTKMHISCVLSVVYHDLCSDKEREEFNNECIEFIKALREKDDIQSRVRTISVLSVLLQGPFDIGNAILGSENLVDLMIQMAGSNDPIQERIAVEAIVLSASKKDKAAGIIQQGADILKNLYRSTNEDIKVLALVGLSKIASSKGTDTSTSLVAEGSCQTLSRACCKFLTTSQSFDIRRWSADGLAYLSLDADVKEELVNNLSALKALFTLCQCQDAHVLYSITTIFVNLTNTYDIRKPDKEMVELAAYAKQHIPKEHPKDEKIFFDERRRKLVEAGIIPVLVQLCKHKSENCREQIARVFLGLCENEKYRGSIVAGGGAKALLPLALEGTSVGMTKATQALAKIAITTNPEIAFPGQRMLEIVRPIIKLLKIEHTALENFEALMALTNLASISENVRKRILKEDGFSNIEQYMFEEHPMLKRAAVECMCNLVVQEEIVKYFTGENDRIKLLVLLCGEEDELLIKAALGTLAVLSSLQDDLEYIKDLNLEDEERKRLNDLIHNNRIICEKILDVKSFTKIFKQLCACNNPDLQFRTFYIIRNIVKTNKELAIRIVETELMDILFAIKEIKDDRLVNEKNRKIASDIVELCLKYGLIQRSKDHTIKEEDETTLTN